MATKPYSVALETWGLPAGGFLGLNVTVGTRWLTRPAGDQVSKEGLGEQSVHP